MSDYSSADFGHGELNERLDVDDLVDGIGLDAASRIAGEVEDVAAANEEQAATVREINQIVERLEDGGDRSAG